MELLTWFVYVAFVAAAMFAIVRSGASSGLLRPVAVGFALRLTVMLSAHFASVAAGGEGFMFLDDRGYAFVGDRIADAWRDGNLVAPRTYDFAGSYVFGFHALVGLVFLLTDSTLLAAKLVNVILGTAAIVVAGAVGRRLAGESAGRYTAWLVALAPTLVWWSAPLLKESLVGLLVMWALLAAMTVPRRSAVVGFLAASLGLVLTRIPAAMAIALASLSAWAVAAVMLRRRIDRRAFGLVALLGAGAAALALLVIGGGNAWAPLVQYASTARSIAVTYGGGDPSQIPADLVRTALGPYPWAFDAGSESWYRALYPGMWVWYVLFPTAVLGLVRLRRRPEVLLFAIPILTLVLANAFTAGFTIRQRSAIEPVLLVLVAVGLDSWRAAVTRGGAALAAISVFAGLQSRSPLVVSAIAAAAAVLILTARRLPTSPVGSSLTASPCLEGIARLSIPAGVSRELRSPVPAPRPARLPVRLATLRAAILRSAALFVATRSSSAPAFLPRLAAFAVQVAPQSYQAGRLFERGVGAFLDLARTMSTASANQARASAWLRRPVRIWTSARVSRDMLCAAAPGLEAARMPARLADLRGAVLRPATLSLDTADPCARAFVARACDAVVGAAPRLGAARMPVAGPGLGLVSRARDVAPPPAPLARRRVPRTRRGLRARNRL